ncbi:DUF3370 domain-containing protein [Candidatus Synechococcus calcipolaris G9]|uniref:DUF3370 domain-containing protein n=1 Tax=Candidatus Synechococcus calcipolaris G9 TaxID=1497997 RepID=A0ABT6EW92_9SYNE|nr:DUF3370 domain-containing protein [Candidatus Synechococcus calcipolaris]MDG2990038.1 DUF3370 domain-containing protein [Candidatus Synechococcus calcipolaris G9]
MLAPMILAQAAPHLPPQQLPGLERQQHPAPRLSAPTAPSANTFNPVQAPRTPSPRIAPAQPAPPVAAPAPPPTAAIANPNPGQMAYLPQEIRSLPGSLDDIPVFNSNSPEMVRTEGILLSTFPPQGKWQPAAHLNYPLQGRFDVFSHHITQSNRAVSTPTLYLGLLAHNPSNRAVTINFYQAASFLSTPDAPFRSLPAVMDNPIGYVFSGPGSRVTNQVLRGVRQTFFPSQIVIPAGESRMLSNLPLPLPTRFPNAVTNRARAEFAISENGEVLPHLPVIADPHPFGEVSSSNGRSTLMHLESNGPVYLAKMSAYARVNPDGTEYAPGLEDWIAMLNRGQLVTPRDIPPSSPDSNPARFFYGRVAGVSRGSQWRANITDDGSSDRLTIPSTGRAVSYGLSTLHRGTLGTGQVQSAPMLARYPDTAYFAHGNYGVHYSLTLPLVNDSRSLQSVALTVQTPLKQDHSPTSLQFLDPPAPQVFFRGTVRVSYADDLGMPQQRYVHLVQRRGQRGEPLVTLNLRPGEQRPVQVDFLYPPDATPPQVLTVATLPNPSYGGTTRIPPTPSPSPSGSDALSLTPSNPTQ